jgi:hypothetical protein
MYERGGLLHQLPVCADAPEYAVHLFGSMLGMWNTRVDECHATFNQIDRGHCFVRYSSML